MSGRPWNLLVFAIDSLRADHLRAYGYPRETAPRFSALAARSVLFEHAFSGAPATSPAMRRIFAVTDAGGRKVSRLGQALEKGGVRAEAVLTARMTDYFGEGVNRIFAALHGVPIEGDVIDRALAPEAERLLLSQSAGLLWVHLASPHLPYLRWPEGPDFGPRAIDRYDGEIAESDRALGRLLDAALRPPLGKETAIVITADLGEELGDHGGEAHGRLGMFYEEIRVPLVIAAPGALPRRVRENVSHDDLAPTLAALLGACDPRLFGRSLVPALAGRPLSPVPILIGPRTPFFGGALIDGRYKLAFVLFNRSLALYDMAADPGERQNLIGRRPELGAQMTTLLRQKLSALSSGWRPQDQ